MVDHEHIAVLLQQSLFNRKNVFSYVEKTSNQHKYFLLRKILWIIVQVDLNVFIIVDTTDA